MNNLNNLSPQALRKKQIVKIVVVGGIVLAIIAAGMIFSGKDTKPTNQNKTTVNKSVMLNKDVDKDIWMANEGGRVKALEEESKRLKNELEKQVEKIGKLELEKEKAKGIKKDNKNDTPLVSLKTMFPPLPDEKDKTAVGSKASAPVVSKEGVTPPNIVNPGGSLFSPSTGISPASPALGAAPGAGSGGIKIFRPEKKSASAADSKKKDTVWLPSGSFVKAQLLSGVDAPTATESANSPHPVLFRLTDAAVLPNIKRLNIRDCFIVGEAYGDLSSERAYIRTVQMSCITKNSETIDMPIKGFASGEDGKIGLRGRLVSKDGTMVGRALVAGFVAGVGAAFKPINNITVSTSGSGYTFPSAQDVGIAGSVGGISKAAEILAEHYTKMAKDIYPVIEIDAFRTVDVVFTQGVDLQVKSTSATPL